MKRIVAVILTAGAVASCEPNPTETTVDPTLTPNLPEQQTAPQSSAGLLLATTGFGELVRVDIEAGTAEFIGAVGALDDGRTPGWSGISFDPNGNLFVTSNQFFERENEGCVGASTFNRGSCAHLYQIDPASGALIQEIGNTGITFLSDIDFSGATLYANFFVNQRLFGDGGLATVDPSSSTATLVGTRFGSGGLDRDLENGALSVHPVTGEIWAVESSFSVGPRIFRVDPVTGLAISPTVRLGFAGVPTGFGLDALEILPDGRFIGTQARGSSNVYLINPEPDPSSGLAELTLIPLSFNRVLAGNLNGLESLALDAPNRPPVADAGDPQTAECTSPDGADVMLDGSGSSDPDNDIEVFEWLENGELIAVGETPTVTLGLGVHTLTIRVTDSGGLSDEDDVQVTVRDTQAPSVVLHVAIVNEFRGKFGEDDAVFRILAPVVADACDPTPTVVALTLNGQPVSPGDLVRLRLRHRTRVKDSDKFALRMEAPSFILGSTVTDASGNTAIGQAAVTLALFANSELDEDEVVPGTGEPGLGVPVDEDASEEMADHLEDLLHEGFRDPDGIHSATVNQLP